MGANRGDDDWVRIADPGDPGVEWRFERSFMSSNWECSWGRGCVGILDVPAEHLLQGCCSEGAQLADDVEAMTVSATAAAVPPHRWQFADRVDDDDVFTDASRTALKVVEGACIFLNRPGFAGGVGCALHLAALDVGERPIDWKPLVCWQAPIKARYKDAPDSAVITLKAEGSLGEGVTCSVQTSRALVEAGLHPATGGSGMHACSGDMLLEALVACAGVTLNAVATALELKIRDAKVRAEGDLDFRGTLGVDKTAPVGFRAIRLSFALDGDLDGEQKAQLLKLTERYCVIFQTLSKPPRLALNVTRA